MSRGMSVKNRRDPLARMDMESSLGQMAESMLATGRRWIWVNETWLDGALRINQDGKQHGIGVFKTAKGDFRRGEWKAGATDSKHQNNSCLEYSCVRKGTESAGYRKHGAKCQLWYVCPGKNHQFCRVLKSPSLFKIWEFAVVLKILDFEDT